MSIESNSNPETDGEDVETRGGPLEAGHDNDGAEGESAEDGSSEAADAAKDETDEIEHEGKKYRIPKPLKGALLMRADYTRKTQELAEARKAHEDAVRQHTERQQWDAEFLADVARVQACDDTLQQFEKVDWAALFADPNKRETYHQLQFQRQQMLEQKSKATETLNRKAAERNSQQQQESARQFEKFRSDTIGAIPEMANPDYVAKLNSFAQSLGFTAQELGQVRDVRIVQALKAAFDGSQLAQKQAVAAKAKVVAEAKPLPTVTARSNANPVKASEADSDKLSGEEWLKRRKAELKKQRGRP